MSTLAIVIGSRRAGPLIRNKQAMKAGIKLSITAIQHFSIKPKINSASDCGKNAAFTKSSTSSAVIGALIRKKM